MTLASLERVSFRRGARRVIDDVTLRIEPGEHVGLVGPNGAGKSTVLRLLLGLEVASAGRVVPCPRGTGYVPQGHAESLFPWFSVLRNVAMPLLVGGRGDALDRARAVCGRVVPGLDVQRSAGSLSGGEKQAMAVARALAAPGDVVVADEPFSALSTSMRVHVRQVLREDLRGRALLLVSHDPDDVSELCDRVLRVEEGQLFAVRVAP